MDSTQDIDYWLDRLRERRWLLHFHERRSEIGAVLTWPGVWDVLVLVAEQHSLAYRTPRAPDLDPFDPEYIVDCYAGPAVWTIRWIMTLPPPGPVFPPLRPVPADFSIPRNLRRPTIIRPIRHRTPPEGDDFPHEQRELRLS
ncbi:MULTISPECIES: hypothetical protein [Actinokineospora]|uniref:Uncharacterized protein n=1 Tax=Actinokineospora fastidiosa TaxID=1816 RepID=A0A918G9J8_9PSEU|nr:MULTISPECIES: hypothetical protein [Actinokineospora]GGS24918.1 hypothetical protein GCM10010171_17660 [Actinokineospora fastidiosa]